MRTRITMIICLCQMCIRDRCKGGNDLAGHLPYRCRRVLLSLLHSSWLCRLFRLSSVLTAHVLCRQLVGFLHKCHLLVHRGSLALLAFQFRLQRCDALQQLVHLRIVILRLFVEVAEGGVQVTVGGCGGLDEMCIRDRVYTDLPELFMNFTIPLVHNRWISLMRFGV